MKIESRERATYMIRVPAKNESEGLPTEHRYGLKNLGLLPAEEFGEHVEKRGREVTLSVFDIAGLVYCMRSGDE